MIAMPLVAIIDDDASLQAAIVSLLRSMDIPARGYDSAEAFLADGATVDCVISDVEMPGMSGPELQRRLRAAGQACPMIFITAYPNARLRDQVMAAGAAGFLGKPFEARALLTMLQGLLPLP